MNDEVKKNNNSEVVYYTQKELAQRWRITEATVKSIRDRGEIPYFFPPNSSRVLYPREKILTIEQEQLRSTNKEVKSKHKLPEIMVKKPVNPTKSDKEWRI